MSFGSFGSFGTAAPSTGFNWGTSAPTTTTSAFGQPSSAFPSSGFSFGSATNNPSTVFGSTTTTAPSTGFGFAPFGGSTSNLPNTGMFGFNTQTQNTSNPFSFSGLGQQQQPQQQQQSLFGQPLIQQQPIQQTNPTVALLEKQLLELRAAYDPSSPQCRFQSIVYNRVPSNSIKSFIAPAHANPTLWQRAVANNPDPSCLVPALVVGFADLHKRITAQQQARIIYLQSLQLLKQSIDEMLHTHTAYTLPLLASAQQQQQQQSSHLFHLLNQVIKQQSQGIPLLPDEVEFCSQVEALALQLQQVGMYTDRLHEIQRKIKALRIQEQQQQQLQPLQRSMSITTTTTGGTNAAKDPLLSLWSPADWNRVKSVLETQTKALEFLSSVITEDKEILQILKQVTELDKNDNR